MLRHIYCCRLLFIHPRSGRLAALKNRRISTHRLSLLEYRCPDSWLVRGAFNPTRYTKEEFDSMKVDPEKECSLMTADKKVEKKGNYLYLIKDVLKE